MDSSELRDLAQHSRFMKEAGVALLISSLLLLIFIYVPVGQNKETPSQTAVATSTVPDAFANVSIEAKAAIVYDLATSQVLYEKNADAQLPLASLTKLLTVYAALAEFPPSAPITIPEDAINLGGPHAFNVGQTFALDDLARLTLTGSLNDGATAMADATAAHENLSDSDMLAGVAAALNLSETYAVNGSGLDVNKAISGGYGSASDIAHLAGALVEKAPDIAAATIQNSAEAVSEGGTTIKVKNTDPIVEAIPGLLLSKTGYTDLAGGNLALVFDSGIEHPIAIVVLGSSETSRFTDGMTLVQATFAHFAGLSSP